MQTPIRQQIREQLGVLEEKLEELGALAGANERMSLHSPDPVGFGTEVLFQEALDSLKALGQLVHEQQLTKSVAATDFLQKIISLLVQDAAAQGCELAVSHYGEGKISMEMAELVMGAIVAGFRASLRSQKALGRAERAELNLFPVGSIYVEVRASASEIQFRLIDDGAGFPAADGLTAGVEKQFDKLREHVARSGGWFGRSSLGEVGGAIEFKVPLAHNRQEALVLREGDFEVLLPAACVAEAVEHGQGRVPEGALVLRPNAAAGLEPCPPEGNVFLRVGVADLQFWITCESLQGKVLARRSPAGEFTAPDSWLQCFGLFHDKGAARALPLLEGTILIRFHRENSGGNA